MIIWNQIKVKKFLKFNIFKKDFTNEEKFKSLLSKNKFNSINIKSTEFNKLTNIHHKGSQKNLVKIVTNQINNNINIDKFSSSPSKKTQNLKNIYSTQNKDSDLEINKICACNCFNHKDFNVSSHEIINSSFNPYINSKKCQTINNLYSGKKKNFKIKNNISNEKSKILSEFSVNRGEQKYENKDIRNNQDFQSFVNTKKNENNIINIYKSNKYSLEGSNKSKSSNQLNLESGNKTLHKTINSKIEIIKDNKINDFKTIQDKSERKINDFKILFSKEKNKQNLIFNKNNNQILNNFQKSLTGNANLKKFCKNQSNTSLNTNNSSSGNKFVIENCINQKNINSEKDTLNNSIFSNSKLSITNSNFSAQINCKSNISEIKKIIINPYNQTPKKNKDEVYSENSNNNENLLMNKNLRRNIVEDRKFSILDIQSADHFNDFKLLIGINLF